VLVGDAIGNAVRDLPELLGVPLEIALPVEAALLDILPVPSKACPAKPTPDVAARAKLRLPRPLTARLPAPNKEAPAKA
jgi:hypothetical protein